MSTSTLNSTGIDRSQLRGGSGFTGILRDDTHYGSGREDDAADQINSWFDTLLIQSGAGISGVVIMMLCLLSALVVGGIVFVWQEDFLLTALAAMVGFTIPVFSLIYMRSARQKKILHQIPEMLEELSRASRTGRSVEQSLSMIARTTPLPLGDELQVVSRRLALGLPLREALLGLTQRTGINTLGLLTTSLVVHQTTGGNLSSVLDRLSATVRDRMVYLGRLRASTVASRATAILMLVLPLSVVMFLLFRDPDYLRNLWASPWGRNATMLAILLQIIGSVWVLRILKTSQPT